LEGLIDEVGREAGEGELLRAGDELCGGGAGDDGAVEVDRGGGEARINGSGAQGGWADERAEGENGHEGFHREK